MLCYMGSCFFYTGSAAHAQGLRLIRSLYYNGIVTITRLIEVFMRAVGHCRVYCQASTHVLKSNCSGTGHVCMHAVNDSQKTQDVWRYLKIKA